MIVIFILSLIVNVALSSDSMSPSRSYRWKSTSGSWGYRSILAGQFAFGPFNGAWFRSVDRSAINGTFDSDIIWGLVYCTPGSPPTSWLGYFSATANVTRIPHNRNWDWSSFDVEVSSGFIANSYLRLIEKDPSGAVVDTIEFNKLLFDYEEAASAALTNATAGIYAFVINGTHFWKDTRVQLRYIVTEEAGQLDMLDGLQIVPKSLESIILIEDYPYHNPNNTLTLVSAAATAEGTWVSKNQFQAGTGAGKVFFHVASTAEVDGVMVDVEISGRDVGDVAKNISPILWKQIAKKYKKAEAQIVSVQFPAGAKSIVYDPTIGSGDSPYDVVPSSNVLAIVLGVVGGLVLITLVVSLIVYNSKSDYSSIPDQR